MSQKILKAKCFNLKKSLTSNVLTPFLLVNESSACFYCYTLVTLASGCRLFTCFQTDPHGAWCYLCGFRATSCTCHVLDAHSRDESYRWQSPWCHHETEEDLLSMPKIFINLRLCEFSMLKSIITLS